MDTILALASVAGLAGSLALVGWGMVLSLTHGLSLGSPAAREPDSPQGSPVGTLS